MYSCHLFSQFHSDQLDNIRNQTIASILCKTLEDDPDLNFQQHVLLTSKANAEANLE